MKDNFGREIDYIRISVTDRCNLRCIYCMPEDGVELMSHSEILSYEEILRIVRCAATLGIRKVRLTGGEPLVRRGIVELIKDIKGVDGIENVSITTNGILLCDMLDDLISAGLDGVNISLDTLNPSKFERITRRSGFEKVLEAINKCCEKGLNTKVNCVSMLGVNDDEIVEIASLAKNKNMCVRFIEFMPVGGNDTETAIPSDEIKAKLEQVFGELTPDKAVHGNGPAVYFTRPDFKGSIGLISAMSNCFCASCNRVRLTAEGFLKLCLQYNTGISLRDVIRGGATDEELIDLIRGSIAEKPHNHTFNDYKNEKNIEKNGMSRIGG